MPVGTACKNLPTALLFTQPFNLALVPSALPAPLQGLDTRPGQLMVASLLLRPAHS